MKLDLFDWPLFELLWDFCLRFLSEQTKNSLDFGGAVFLALITSAILIKSDNRLQMPKNIC